MRLAVPFRTARAMMFAALGGCIAIAAPATQAQACPAGPNALGVSRTVSVDATGGPRFGAQYPGNDFLKPKEVVLTFDDGPSAAKTPAILKALADHCTKGTFFIVGRMALVEPDILRQTLNEGHTIALHTWSHKKLTKIPADQAKHEIELGYSIVAKSLNGPVAPFFRFPYLAAPNSMLKYLGERNIATFGIDVDSKDFMTRKPSVMMRNVLKQLEKRGKGIILFHDIQRSTAAGLKSLLDELKKRGYKIVHVTGAKPSPTIKSFDQRAEQMIAKRKIASARKQKLFKPNFGPDSPAAQNPDKEVLPWLVEQPKSQPARQPSVPAEKPWWEF